MMARSDVCLLKILIFVIYLLPLIENCYIEQECYTLKNVKGNYYSMAEMKNLSKARQTHCGGSCVDNNADLICCPYQDETENYRLLHQSCLDAHLPYDVITLGDDRKSNEFPFMAALGWRVRNSHGGESIVYRCAATMIEDRYLITAAHCLHHFSDRPVVVRPGGFDLNTQTKITKNYEIDQIIAHPNYRYPSLYNDLAIIRIKQRYVGDIKTVDRACIWYGPLGETPVTAIGYGNPNFAQKSGKQSSLMKKNLSTISNDECSADYKEDRKRLNAGIDSTQICARDDENSRYSCPGDFGGPIIMYDVFKDYKPIAYIVGITSFGIDCVNGKPGIYTRVSEYFDWIEDVVFK